jgi:CSLREA domain-containing protein
MGVLAGGLALAGLSACQPGPRLDLTVTTTADLVDRAPGDGVCEATIDLGDCSLRAAVMEANATPTATIVRVVLAPDAQYVLSRQVNCGEEFSEPNDDAVEDLDINRSLTISGNGATIRTSGGTFVDPSYGTVDCLIRGIEHHAGRLALQDLTLRGSTYGRGGALRSDDTAQLSDVVVTGQGTVGGVGIDTSGDLRLVRSKVIGGGGFGSPVIPFPKGDWAGIWSRGGSLVLLDSEVSGNNRLTRFSDPDFAGIHVASGDATIVQSIVTGHLGFIAGPVLAAVPGDGIDARGPVQLIRSTVVANGDGRDLVGTATIDASGSLLGRCGTVIASSGYNADADSSCLGLGDPTDLPSSPTTFVGLSEEHPWLPVTGSAVIDAVPAGTPTLCDGAWPTDVRGAVRPSADGCDIGALERQATDP